jgi:Cu-processing system permease protein
MTTLKIARYQLRDVARSRWVLFYGLFFLGVTDALFRFGGGGDRVVLSLMNVVLVMIPLVSVVLGAMYLYGAREYIELLLAQPLRRPTLFRGLWVGLALPLSGAFVAGVALPFAWHREAAAGHAAPLGLLLGTGVLLTLVFVSLAFAVALRTEDRLRGLGVALAAWMFFAVVWNGVVLLGIQLFADYPLERGVIAASLLNPVDLGRILLLLNLDVSAMMGFTGAVFQQFFGSGVGQGVTLVALFLWLAVPFLVGQRAFVRKNF